MKLTITIYEEIAESIDVTVSCNWIGYEFVWCDVLWFFLIFFNNNWIVYALFAYLLYKWLSWDIEENLR